MSDNFITWEIYSSRATKVYESIQDMACGGRVVITSPDEEARGSFIRTLQNVFVIHENNDVVTCSSNDLNSRTAGDIYFLVLPRSSRYNIYIEDDKSSMVEEIQLMCGGPPRKNNVKEGTDIQIVT